MAVEIAHDPDKQVAVMYCNTSDSAFGPIFTGPTAYQDAQDFIDWLRENEEPVSWAVAVASVGDGRDPRDYRPDELERVVLFWREVTENARPA